MGQLIPPLIKAKRAEHDLPMDEKLMNILQSYHVVRLNNDSEFAEKLAWCLEHCQNKFRDLSDAQGRSWYFQNEHDATMFAMKWS